MDLGIRDTAYGKKHKVCFVYILDEADSEGRQKRAFESVTLSFNEKARLRKHVISVLAAKGQKLDPAAKEFDTETLIGDQVTLVLAKEDGTDGKQYTKIVSVMKPAKGQDVRIPEDFKRKQDRTD